MQGEGNPSQGSLVEDYKDWIEWRGCRVDMPDWWQEIVGIPGINNFWELTQKIRASFELPQVKSEAQVVENNYLAPPAPKCIQWKDFLPPPNPIFPCQDWAEKSNVPMPGQPHLLVGCVLELRRAMEPYVAFSDDAILEGATPQERSLEGQTRALFPGRPSQPLPRFPLRRQLPWKSWSLPKLPPKRWPPWRSPLRSQLPWRPPPASQQENQIFPLCRHEDKERERLPIVISLAGQRYCILPSQQPLPEKSCHLLVGWGEGITARVWGEGEPNVREQKNADKLSKKGQFLNHHQGTLNLCPRLHHHQASRELQPAYWGNHPHQLSLK